MFLIIIRLIIIKDYVIGICLQQLHWFYKPFLTVIRREEAEWMSNFVKLKLKLSLLNSFCSYIYIYIYARVATTFIILFIIYTLLFIYYAHLNSVRFEHFVCYFVCCASLIYIHFFVIFSHHIWSFYPANSLV